MPQKPRTKNQQLTTQHKPLGFTLIELLVVISIIGILSVIGLNSFGSARIKARDSARKTDLSTVSKALELYYNDLGEYPDDNGTGSIMGCGADAIEECTWGTSEFSNTTTGEIYIVKLPEDSNSSYSYYYESFTVYGLNTSYQLYARLENIRDIAVSKDDDDNPLVFATTPTFNCGTLACNYGVSSSNLAVDDGRTLTTE